MKQVRSTARQALRYGLRRLRGDQAGNISVEFAFVAPVFIAIILIVIEFGRVMYSKVEFEYAVFNATRFGMVSRAADTTKVKQALNANLFLLDPAHLKTVTVAEVTNPDKTRTATLTAAYQVDFLFPITVQKSLTLTKTVSFLRGP